jgi:transcriptional regulator NrdR family protein
MTRTRTNRDERGIACPQCGCRHFDTTHTEPLRDGRIRRRKVCRYCGRKVLTFESKQTAIPPNVKTASSNRRWS